MRRCSTLLCSSEAGLRAVFKLDHVYREELYLELFVITFFGLSRHGSLRRYLNIKCPLIWKRDRTLESVAVHVYPLWMVQYLRCQLMNRPLICFLRAVTFHTLFGVGGKEHQEAEFSLSGSTELMQKAGKWTSAHLRHGTLQEDLPVKTGASWRSDARLTPERWAALRGWKGGFEQRWNREFQMRSSMGENGYLEITWRIQELHACQYHGLAGVIPSEAEDRGRGWARNSLGSRQKLCGVIAVLGIRTAQFYFSFSDTTFSSAVWTFLFLPRQCTL